MDALVSLFAIGTQAPNFATFHNQGWYTYNTLFTILGMGKSIADAVLSLLLEEPGPGVALGASVKLQYEGIISPVLDYLIGAAASVVLIGVSCLEHVPDSDTDWSGTAGTVLVNLASIAAIFREVELGEEITGPAWVIQQLLNVSGGALYDVTAVLLIDP